jgi:hypothetical protein
VQQAERVAALAELARIETTLAQMPDGWTTKGTNAPQYWWRTPGATCARSSTSATATPAQVARIVPDGRALAR